MITNLRMEIFEALGNTQNARILRQEMYYLPRAKHAAAETERREMMLSPILRQGSPRWSPQPAAAQQFTIQHNKQG